MLTSEARRHKCITNVLSDLRNTSPLLPLFEEVAVDAIGAIDALFAHAKAAVDHERCECAFLANVFMRDVEDAFRIETSTSVHRRKTNKTTCGKLCLILASMAHAVLGFV